MAVNGHAATLRDASGIERLRGPEAAVALADGATLAVGDRVRTASAGRGDVRLPGVGDLELGADAELALLALPSADTPDAVTQVALASGYLRLRWQADVSRQAWPMVVDLSGVRLNLAQGDYLVEAHQGQALFCIIAGRAAIAVRGRRAPQEVAGRSCHRLQIGQPPRPLAFTPKTLTAATALRKLAVALQGGVPLPVAGKAPEASRSASFAAAMNRAINGTPTVPLRVARGPVAAPAPARGWVVNAGSFPKRPLAVAFGETLTSRGFQGHRIVAADVAGKTWFRVQFSGLMAVGEAKALVARLAREAEVESAWIQTLR